MFSDLQYNLFFRYLGYISFICIILYIFSYVLNFNFKEMIPTNILSTQEGFTSSEKESLDKSATKLDDMLDIYEKKKENMEKNVKSINSDSKTILLEWIDLLEELVPIMFIKETSKILIDSPEDVEKSVPKLIKKYEYWRKFHPNLIEKVKQILQ